MIDASFEACQVLDVHEVFETVLMSSGTIGCVWFKMQRDRTLVDF